MAEHRSDAGPADGGFATVWAVGAIACLLAVITGGLYLGSAAIARHHAESAADLAALAGAGRAVAGRQAACTAAGDVADAMDVSLVSCRVERWDVLVEVSVRGDLLPGRFAAATGRARAGPVPP